MTLRLTDFRQAVPTVFSQYRALIDESSERKMAIDVYLQIEGIKGESQDQKHKGWIECLSVHWGINQPRSATASTSGGHTAERVEMEDIAFNKLADLSSPVLMQYCAMGKPFQR